MAEVPDEDGAAVAAAAVAVEQPLDLIRLDERIYVKLTDVS